MFFKQYYLGCLSHASYMIADEETKTAAIVDPQRDIGQYLTDAGDKGWKIRYVFLTHFHADFLAGHIELRERTGAQILLGAKAKADYAFAPLKEGDAVAFGKVRIQALETPGHTPEAVTLLVFDLAKDAKAPQAALTGDTLFIGDVGRPDLFASIGVTADQLADMLYDSLHEKILKLPDATLIYPAHGAGSMCGKNLSKETVSTLGEQRKYNYALQHMSREEFKRLVTADQPEAPAYFAEDAMLNRQERPTLNDAMKKSLKPLLLADVLRHKSDGAQLLDVREAAEFDGAHLAGSINVGLGGKYATWCGTVLRKDKPIIVIGEPGQEEEATMRLGRIGFDNVLGFLNGGMAALKNTPELVRSIRRVTGPALAELLAEPQPPLVVDVRTPREHAGGHIAGSQLVPLNQLAERMKELPRGRTLAIHCEGGYRSAIAASLLANAGFESLMDMVGGFKAWAAAKLPVKT